MSEPCQLYHYIFDVLLCNLGAVIGVGILHPNYKITAFTIFWISINVCMLFNGIYTVYAYDRETKWKCLCLYGITFQGFVKFASVFIYNVEIRANAAFVRSVCEMNQQRDTPNDAILVRWSRICLRCVQLGTVCICSSIGMFVLLPFIKYMFTGVAETILPDYFPGIDETTTTGYWILWVYHMLVMFMAATGTSGADLMFVAFLMYLWPMVFIFDEMLKQMNRALSDAWMMGRSVDRDELRAFIRNIIQMHQEIRRYLMSLANIHKYVIFMEIYTNNITLIFMLLCFMTMNYINFYFLFAVMFMKLFMFCCLGTMVEMTSDQILKSIELSNWYMLPTDLQLDIMLMWYRAQKPTVLKAHTVPLNLDTLVKVIKSVYTVGMLLIELVQ